MDEEGRERERGRGERGREWAVVDMEGKGKRKKWIEKRGRDVY